MRTFAQKQNQSQKPVSSSLARSNTAAPGLHHRADLILHLQRALGNQAVQQMLQPNAEELDLGLTATASPRFGHDFSRIPLHSPTAGTIQTKLAINKPGDEYEQEADRVSEQVMRMPEPQLQRSCACGGGCPECQTEQPVSEPERLQTKRVGSGDLGQTAAPPIVHEVLRSPGQPLDVCTRAFFEPRFGHDFSRVRVHTGASAAVSARSVGAQAFTVGNSIVFGSGEFAPHHSAGRRLLAHELTHTVQQGAAGYLSRTLQKPLSMQITQAAPVIQRRTLGIAGACWFENCQTQLPNFFMIPEDGPPGFHPSGSGSSFRVDDVDGLWFKFHTPKDEWFKIPDIATGQVTCTDNEEAPNIRSPIIPFATADWTNDAIHTPNPY